MAGGKVVHMRHPDDTAEEGYAMCTGDRAKHVTNNSRNVTCKRCDETLDEIRAENSARDDRKRARSDDLKRRHAGYPDD